MVCCFTKQRVLRRQNFVPYFAIQTLNFLIQEKLVRFSFRSNIKNSINGIENRGTARKDGSQQITKRREAQKNKGSLISRNVATVVFSSTEIEGQ